MATKPYTPKIVNPLSEPWRWKHFAELEGKGIRHIAETADQKVWVSCNEGVLEYDGYYWKTHYVQAGEHHIPVEQLLVAADQSIYATSAKGIFRYDGKEWEPFFVVPDNLEFIFHRIKQLADKSIIACADWGLIHFSKNQSFTFYTSQPKIAQLNESFPTAHFVTLPKSATNDNNDFLYVSDILEINKNKFWLAVSTQLETGKIVSFNLNDIKQQQIINYEVIESSDDLQLGEGQQFLLAADQKIWVINSSSNKGIGLFDGEKWEYFHLNQLFGGDEYMVDIIQSANGTIWISSMAKIFAYKDKQWQLYKSPYPIPANRVILQNSQKDQIWVAGYKSKMLLLDFSTEQWVTYDNLSFQCEIKPEEQFFLEVNNQIIHRKGEVWQSYDTSDGIMDTPIRVIYTTKGQVWAAGSHRGVAATALLKNGQWERHLHPKLSWGIDYRSVFEAKDGSLWFGGSVDGEKKLGFLSGVLQLLNPTAENLTWKHHIFEENGLTQANAYGIGQSVDGRIWIGGSRLLYYDGETWNALADERLQQYINIVYSTDSLLIAGSRYYGVFIYDGKTWKNYNTDSGLSGNTIISIDAHSSNDIFVATEHDICRFDGISWTKNVFPEKLNMDFEGGTILHTPDQTIWINHEPRSWKRRAYQNNKEEAENWKFFTTAYRPNRTPPETNVDFYLSTISQEGNSLISWKGIDYFAQTPMDKLMYSYRIDGDDWSIYTHENQHTFTSQSSGQHTLEIRARDLDFNVDATPVVIEYEVLPPVWKQAWFILLILTFLTIYGIYEYRVISKKKKLELLNDSLQQANFQLKERGQQIEVQNQEILHQKEQILIQSKTLEVNNQDLEARNIEIGQQRDALEIMVAQVENLSKAKLSFFTNISHELRTPLTLIMGPILQLQKEGEKLPPEDTHRLYHVIQRNTSRLLKLINQLLEIRRIEHSALELHLSPIRLSDYIGEMMDLFKNTSIKRDIHLEFTDESHSNLVMMDADKIEKIIVNLLSNAFKYTPEGGSIIVELGIVTALAKDLNPCYDEYFEIIIEDTGTGIEQEKINKIFEKYYTGSIKGQYVNSGIGLSYVRDLIYLMQGQIQVESQVGKGTKFIIYMPYMPVQETPESKLNIPANSFKIAQQEVSLLLNASKEEATQEKSNKEHKAISLSRILLVEDNPEMLQFLENILRSKYQILKAKDGKEGLKIAKNQTLDLIVSDVMMPEMDGFTFCNKIKSNFSTSHLPVILLTAKTLADNKMSGFREGADEYITKPFNPELLLVRIENLLQQRAKLRELFVKDFMLTPKTEQITSPDEELLQKLVDMMQENLHEPDFNVDKMCKMVYLSHMHFIRKVKQLTGKKPVDLLKSFRMKKAKELLAKDKLSVSEVAYKVGFDLPNSFSRSFKKEFKMTPTEFVNSLKKADKINIDS